MLHEEGTFEEAKRLFNEEFDGVDVTEITSAEKSLIQGGLKAEEIQKLCNIHSFFLKVQSTIFINLMKLMVSLDIQFIH